MEYDLRVSGQYGFQLTAAAPYPSCMIPTCCNDVFAVWRESHVCDDSVMPLKNCDQAAILSAPYFRSVVPAGCDYASSIRRKGYSPGNSGLKENSFGRGDTKRCEQTSVLSFPDAHSLIAADSSKMLTV